MKKSELVLGQMIKNYKGEAVHKITSIGAETVILDDEKEVKTSTLLKNFKVAEKKDPADVDLGSNLIDLMAVALNGEIDTTEPEAEDEMIPVVEEIDETEPEIEEEIVPAVEEIEDTEEVEPEVEVPSEEMTDKTKPEIETKVTPVEENEVEDPKAEEPTEAPKAPKQRKTQVTGYIYGVPVIRGNVNQTTIWKILKEVCKNKDDEGTKVANDLYEHHKEVFEGAKRCLVTKKRIAYIDSIIEENN